MPRLGGIEKDDGQYVTTLFWMPFMQYIRQEEKERNGNKSYKENKELKL